MLGANIGTCATALAASIGATAEAKRVAVAHIAFKVLGAALVFPFIGPFTAAGGRDRRRSGAADRERPHACSTSASAWCSCRSRRWPPRAIEALVPDEPAGETPFRARYLDERALDQPSLALGQATREALRMADVVQGMLRDALPAFRTDNPALIEDVEKRDDQVDFLEREIKLFLARLGREAMGPDLSRKEIGLISFIGNLENIGDIIDKNLMELARKKLYQGRRFSEAGWAEILEFHGLVVEEPGAGDRRLRRQRPGARAGGAGPAAAHAGSASASCASRTWAGCAPGSPSRWRRRRSTWTC